MWKDREGLFIATWFLERLARLDMIANRGIYRRMI